MDGQQAKSPEWILAAREQLLRARDQAAGWGYRPGTEPFVEPTVLACLALLATDAVSTSERRQTTLGECARWLASIQQPDGALGLSASLATPQWPTAYAILLWSALNVETASGRRAADWLLHRRGYAFVKEPDNPIGHDTTLVGWPWVADTHSWVEPTALAILALQRVDLVQHDRVQEGIRVILDRAIPGRGWNYGNNAVFGSPLRPLPGPTGLALLALAAVRERSAAVEGAISFLKERLPAVRSAQSLCWGVLGLAAWDHRPQAAEDWLVEAYDGALRRSDVALQLAYLLLASHPAALSLLGIKTQVGTAAGADPNAGERP